MSAHPIYPGKAYRVRHQGRSIVILAANGAEACAKALEIFFNL